MEDYADNPKTNMYFIREGMDHYKDIPLYRVESEPESEIEYVGEWTENKADAEIELNEMTERANKHLKKGYEGYEDLYGAKVVNLYNSIDNYRNKLENMSDDELADEYVYEVGVSKDDVMSDIEDERDEYISELLHRFRQTLKSRGEYALGGYTRPAYNLKTSGVYLFKTNKGNFEVKSNLFERVNDTEDSLEIQDELRNEIGSVIIKNSDWKKLASGKSVKARSSKGNFTGTMTRIEKANVGLLLAGASLLQQRQAQKQGQRSKWEDRGMDYRQPQYYYPAPQPAQPQPTQPQNPMGQVDQQQLMNALMMSKGKFATGGMPEMNDEVTLGFTHYYTIRGNYQEAKDYADNLKTQHPRWDVIVTEDNNNFYILVRTPIKMGNRVYGEGGNVGQTVKYKHWSGDIRTGVVLGMTKDGDYDVQYGTSHVLVKPNEIIEMHKRGGLPNKNWKVKSYESADGDIYYVQNGKKIYRQGDIKITSINQAEKLAKELNNDLSTNKSVTFYLKKSLLHGGRDYSTGGGSPFYHIDNLFDGYKTKEILPNQYIVYDLETPIAEHLGSIKRYFQSYEINNKTNKFSGGGYPTGRAWTREHYHDNDAEDYEVDPRKRKVGARNRKFMAGGFTPNGYVTIIFNEKPHHFSAEYIGGQIEDIDLYSGDYAQDLANFIEKEFDEWLETAPKDYQSMYYGEYDEPAIYSKSGAIDQAYEYIEQDLIDMVKSGKKAVLDIDKGDFVEAFYAKGGNIFKSFEDFGKWFMGSRKQYPTGRAWTREHYHDNDDEDYEVDPKKRKVRARNRKYDVGGSTDGERMYRHSERYPRRADDTGKGIFEGYVVNDGEMEFETEEGLLKHLRSLNWEDADGNRSQDITDDDDLLEYFYNEDYYYWTQWDNSEIEDQGYYYTADGELVEINARGGYPTGRAWTREHYHDNDDEDYEIDPNKRKVRARNRKYNVGGGVEDFYIWQHPKNNYYYVRNTDGKFLSTYPEFHFVDNMFGVNGLASKELAQELIDKLATNRKYSFGGGIGEEVYIYEDIEAPDSRTVLIGDEVDEYIEEWNETMQTNYANWKEFNEGEEYYRILPLEEFKRGGNIFRSLEDFGRWFKGQSRSYPTGRAWTREHYHDNDAEDYEVDPRKRKVRARNRKYNVGGGIDDMKLKSNEIIILNAVYLSRIDGLNGQIDYFKSGDTRWFDEQVRGDKSREISRLEEKKQEQNDNIKFLRENGYPFDLTNEYDSKKLIRDLHNLVRTNRGREIFGEEQPSATEYYKSYEKLFFKLEDLVEKKYGKIEYAGGGKTEKRYIILSPDGFPIYHDQTFTEEEIIPAFEEWKKRYERQGYYSTGNRERIPLEDLEHYCDIVEADENMFKNGGQLIGNQYKIDMNKNGRIDAEDFKILRSTMNGAWRNEHKHVNHSEDWETRYARKTNSSRTGYKGRKEYGDGGGIEEYATGKLVGKGSRGKNQYNKEVDAYKWFVVSDKNHVDSGWEYKEDATDQAKELSEGKFMGSSWKVMSLVTLKKKGIADPREDWKYKYSVGGFLLGTGVGAVLGNEIAKSGIKATASKIGKGATNIKNRLKTDYADFRQASKKKKVDKFAVGGKPKVVQYQDLSKIKPDVLEDSAKTVTKIPEIELKKTGNIVEFEGKKITSSKDAYNILNDVWNKDLIEAVEQTYVLFLNRDNKPIGYYHHSQGGITATVLDKEIISAMAVKSLSSGVIVAHNHPSGALRPSDADIRIAKEVREALKLFGIQLLDALILTKSGYYSFAENGDI